MKRLERLVLWAGKQPRQQIEFFGSDKFMWIAFATFFLGLTITYLIHK